MTNIDSPCRNCTEETGRSADPNCHGYCERYKVFKQAVKRQNQLIREAKEKDAGGFGMRRKWPRVRKPKID